MFAAAGTVTTVRKDIILGALASAIPVGWSDGRDMRGSVEAARGQHYPGLG